MSLVQNLKRAYGCPYGTAATMGEHISGAKEHPALAAILGLGPMRVHYKDGWRLDNKPAGYREIMRTWRDRESARNGREFFA